MILKTYNLLMIDTSRGPSRRTDSLIVVGTGRGPSPRSMEDRGPALLWGCLRILKMVMPGMKMWVPVMKKNSGSNFGISSNYR